MKILLVAATLVAIVGCTSSQGYVPSQFTDADAAMQERAFIANLADPGSAQTRDIQVFQAPNGNRLICGMVNAKNAFGGFIGFQTFAVGTAGIVDYSQPFTRPIFATGPVAAIDCGGAGYVSSV